MKSVQEIKLENIYSSWDLVAHRKDFSLILA